MLDREKYLYYFNKYADETADRVQSGIEQNRKGWGHITVTDREGNPVPGAKLTFEQKDHEFKFGANLFMLDEFSDEKYNEIYRERFADLFNLATLPFYWSDLEPVQGKPRFSADSPKIYRRPAPDLCLDFCREHGIEPKAHCLTYVNFTPDWCDLDDIPQTKRLLQKRYSELADRYSGVIPSWEVINETLCYKDTRKSQNSAFFGMHDLVEWNFALAEKYFPANELILNEATGNIWQTPRGERSNYNLLVEKALSKGSRIDAIGMQYHMFYTPERSLELAKYDFNPRSLFDVMDSYDKYNLPLQITEITVPAYTDEAEDEELQAELMEKLYSVWFSHKNMEAIIYWNLPDGYAAFAPLGDMQSGENYYRGGLLRFDLSKKPIYERMQELVKKTWHTETAAESNGEGFATFKGFYGSYSVKVEAGNTAFNTEIRLTKSGKNDFSIVLA